MEVAITTVMITWDKIILVKSNMEVAINTVMVTWDNATPVILS